MLLQPNYRLTLVSEERPHSHREKLKWGTNRTHRGFWNTQERDNTNWRWLQCGFKRSSYAMQAGFVLIQTFSESCVQLCKCVMQLEDSVSEPTNLTTFVCQRTRIYFSTVSTNILSYIGINCREIYIVRAKLILSLSENVCGGSLSFPYLLQHERWMDIMIQRRASEAFPAYFNSHVATTCWWHASWNWSQSLSSSITIPIMYSMCISHVREEWGCLEWEKCIMGLRPGDQKVFLRGVSVSKASDKNGGLF